MTRKIIIRTLTGHEIRYTAMYPIHVADIYYLFRAAGCQVEACSFNDTIRVSILQGPLQCV